MLYRKVLTFLPLALWSFSCANARDEAMHSLIRDVTLFTRETAAHIPQILKREAALPWLDERIAGLRKLKERYEDLKKKYPDIDSVDYRMALWKIAPQEMQDFRAAFIELNKQGLLFNKSFSQDIEVFAKAAEIFKLMKQLI